MVERCLCKADASGSSPLTSSQPRIERGNELWYFEFEKNQSIKGVWCRPRDLEPMKGVTTDEMPRGAGRMLRSEDSRMGQPKVFLLEFIEKRK